MDLIVIRIAASLAGGLMRPLAKKFGSRALGKPEERALQLACARAIADAIDELTIEYSIDADHLALLVEMVVVELPEIGDNVSAADWIAAAQRADLDLQTFPVPFGQLFERITSALSVHLDMMAQEPDSPLFNGQVIRKLSQIMSLQSGTLSLDVESEEALASALDEAQSSCRLAGRSMYTSDVLLCLLTLPDEAVNDCCNAIGFGLGSELRSRLRRYAVEADESPTPPEIVGPDWRYRRETLMGRKLAISVGRQDLISLDLFAGILDCRSTTQRGLRNLMGDKYEVLRAECESRRIAGSQAGTPGRVFGNTDE